MAVDTRNEPKAVKLLVACQACRRQYDAGRLAPGSRFRCSCGKTVQVPKPRIHTADVVRCSSCGAPRAEGVESCSHCGSDYTLHERDLHTICPACMTRISDRARFCHHCGTPIVPQGQAGEPTERPCPACGERRKLNSRSMGKKPITVLECPGCAGLWIGREALQVIAERARTDALPEELTSESGQAAAGGPGKQRGPLYRNCPECKRMMNRRNFGQRSGVIVDTCREHGTWFDSRELGRILKWIREGGEARANRRAQQEERERERCERTKYDRLEQMSNAYTSRSSFRGSSGRDPFGGFFGSLFDL